MDVVKGISLFQARAIVGVLCSGIGFMTGWGLVAFATQYAEAASTRVSRFFCTPWVPGSVLIDFCKAWATVIHLSHTDNGPGIKLRELEDKTHKPESALSGVKLLWTRFSNRSTDRRTRRSIEWVFPSLHPVTRFVC